MKNKWSSVYTDFSSIFKHDQYRHFYLQMSYIELSNLTDGSVGNVAESNYTSQLTSMGQAVKDL